jgi:phosphonatase-like hydrolase
LVVFDMAGTTISDDGLVIAAFTEAVASRGIDPSHEDFPGMLEYVERTMGASKWTVFMKLFEGDQAKAAAANQAFERAYEGLINQGLCHPVAGAEETIESLRQAGIKVALTTGFSPATRQALIENLGWQKMVNLALSPADAGYFKRGRPFPDMILTALMRLGASDVRAVATVGDTASDIRSGRAAGAGFVAGVLTGTHDKPTLTAASPDAVLPSVAEFGTEVMVKLTAAPRKGRNPL